jgi:hypothetical protein
VTHSASRELIQHAGHSGDNKVFLLGGNFCVKGKFYLTILIRGNNASFAVSFDIPSSSFEARMRHGGCADGGPCGGAGGQAPNRSNLT